MPQSAKSFKIGIDARPLVKKPSGIGIYLSNALSALQKIDHLNHYYLIASDSINFHEVNDRWHFVESRLNKPLLGSVWMQINAPILAKRLGLDIFWGTRHHLPLLMPTKVKGVLTIHDVVHRLYPETMALPNLLLERMLMRLSVNRSDLILADSNSTVQDLNRFYPAVKNKTRVVYPGIPALPAEDAAPPIKNLPERFILFVGTLEPRKNFQRLLQAYMQSNPEKHGVHLVVAGGRGWKTEPLLKKISSPPCADFVKMAGYVSRHQLVDLYKRALCVAFPSLYEGFGLPILEAMACGTAVITANVSSMPEVAGNAALLVDPYDVTSIRRAIVQIVHQEELRLELVRKGAIQRLRFSWDEYARRLIAYFEGFSAGHAHLS